MSISSVEPMVGRAPAAARWLAPGAVFIGALLLYVLNLDDGLVVHDELHHVLAARGLLETGEPRIADGVYQRGYLYTWLVAQAYRLFGEGLFAARLPAALPMAMLVAALFLWLRATAGSLAAWLGTGLFALSPFAVGTAQFARFYGLQSLGFFLGAIACEAALLGPGPVLRRAALATVAVAALLLAVHLQDTTLLGVAGLGLWAGLALGGPRLLDPAVPLRRRLGTLAILGLACLGLLAVLWSGGLLDELWQRYRWTEAFNAERANDVWYYHVWLSLFYPSLWPLTGFIGLLALATWCRPGGLALVVFATAFLLNSFAGAKALRYLAYAFPFLFAVWGMGLAALWPWLRRGLAELSAQLGRTLLPARTGLGRRCGQALAGAALLFLLLANPAWLRTASLLADVPIPPEEPDVRWSLAVPALAPWLDAAGLVVTTSELETLYHLGRYDILISRSRLGELPEAEQHELGRDWRTGRPIISRAETLDRLIDCTATGLILSTAVHWPRTFQADEAVKALVERRATPIELPPASRVLAWHWAHPDGWTRPAGCAAELAIDHGAAG